MDVVRSRLAAELRRELFPFFGFSRELLDVLKLLDVVPALLLTSLAFQADLQHLLFLVSLGLLKLDQAADLLRHELHHLDRRTQLLRRHGR